ncbi:MAG: Ldh family oxidoreductase [Patescibacteria group bacterium]
MKITIPELRKLIYQALKTKHYDGKDADRIAEVILFGQLSNKTSHGIVRLFIAGSSQLAQKPTGKPKIVIDTPASQIIDANQNPAMLVMSLAMEKAMEKATKVGFAITGTRNTYSTCGSLSYYLEKIAQTNLIGIAMARSPLCMASFSTAEPLFGTNPVGFAIPAEPQPFIFDMGTTAISWGALLIAQATGKSLPENVAVDETGELTTNPNKAKSLLSFDNTYKGSGLAMIVEILAGILVGAGFIDMPKRNDWGNFLLVFSPKLVGDVKEFKRKMKMMIERMKKAKMKVGEKMRIPGETTIKTRDENLRKGWIEIDDSLMKQFKQYIKDNS